MEVRGPWGSVRAAMILTRNQRAALNSAAANRAFMTAHGVTYAGHKIWTAEEDELVRRHRDDLPRLLGELPHRSEGAVRRRRQILGLVKPRRVWSEGEFRTMKPPYQDGDPVPEILPLLNEKTPRQVYSKASARRVRRPRRPPKIVGIPLVDTIRQRAFQLGYTLADLDFYTRSGGYFTRPRGLHWRAISHAIRLLGGTVHVRFPLQSGHHVR